MGVVILEVANLHSRGFEPGKAVARVSIRPGQEYFTGKGLGNP